MAKRRLRIVRRTQGEVLGICERCNTRFAADSDKAVEAAFNAHPCKPIDSSQNALRIVREATEDK